MSDASPITNRWGEVPLLRVESAEILTYRAREGAAYSHHPQITSLEGRLYATWSSGVRHEDDVGQRMVMSTSDDEGRTWSRPRTLVEPQEGQFAQEVVTSEGLHVYGNTLVAYYGVYEYTAAGLTDGHRHPAGKRMAATHERWHQRTRTEAIVSEDGGESWSAPRQVVDRFVPNLSPVPLTSGRLIMPGNISFPYSDDPSGLTGWTPSGLPRLPKGYVDDPEGFHRACDQRGDPTHYCEGSFYQTDDGLVRMMLRTSEQRLAVSESRDEGATWSEPRWTSYTDCRCRTHFGRLPDGRYYGLSCPAPGSARTPLVLALGEDGVVFDQHYVLGDAPAKPPRFPGRHKGGRYGYPYLCIVDERVYVIYSIAKEDVAVRRFGLGQLG